MKRDKLLKSKGYNVTKIQNELFRELTEYLDKNNMTQTQFAKQLGVSKGYVSQILNGDFDYKLSKLVELSLAIGKVPQINYVSFEDIKKQPKSAMKVVHLAKKKYSNSSFKKDFKGILFERKDLSKIKIV